MLLRMRAYHLSRAIRITIIINIGRVIYSMDTRAGSTAEHLFGETTQMLGKAISNINTLEQENTRLKKVIERNDAKSNTNGLA